MLEASEAFGQRRRSAGPQKLPRNTFGPDAVLKPGMKFNAEMPGGAPVVVSVRDATDAEKKDGVPAS
jgi:hypothetical protein